MEEIGFYETENSARRVHVVDGLAYVADRGDGLYIIRYIENSGIKDKKKLEEEIQLLNIHSEINIKYSLTERKKVRIEIFNLLGQRIEKLLEDVKPSGIYTFEWNGDSGIYFVRIEIGDKTYRRKAIIIK